MLFNPAYEFSNVAERIVMPEEPKAPKSSTPATSAAAREATASIRVPDHFTGTDKSEFDKWSSAYRQQHLRDATPGFMRKPSAALDF